MKKVMVVGGSGTLGKYVVKEFKDSGYKVSIFDMIKPEVEKYPEFFKDVGFLQGDITKIEDCNKNIRNVDYVVLTAALLYGLNNYPPEMMFAVNTTGAFNVFQAACEAGVKKIIFTSSAAIYGFDLKLSPNEKLIPDYLPVDEHSSINITTNYALTKIVGERTLEFFNRKYGISTISLRIHHIRIPIDTESEENKRKKLSNVEIYRSINKYKENLNSSGMMLWPTEAQPIGEGKDKVWSGFLLAYNDVRDAALGFRLAAEAKGLEGKNEIFNIANTDDNCTSFYTDELIKMYGYKNIPLKKELGEREPLFSCDKAKRMLGFESKYNWWELFGKQMFK